MKFSIPELKSRIARLEKRRRGSRCTGYVIRLDRAEFASEAEFDRTVEAEIMAHRETCDLPFHGFVVAPTVCETLEEWEARYSPLPD